MGFKLVSWLLSNEFIHIRSFLNPLLSHEEIPPRLKRRIDGRIGSGLRLVKIRMVVYAIMFPAVLGLLGSVIFIALGELLDPEVVSRLERLFAILIQIASLMFVVAAVALFVVQRSLRLLLVDVYVMSMEAVAIGVQVGALAPSTQQVKMRKKKTGRSERDDESR